VYHKPSEVIPGALAIPLALPNIFRSILGDGNCLFCPFSSIITGSQEHVHGMFNLNHTAVHQMAMYVWHDVNPYDVVQSVQ